MKGTATRSDITCVTGRLGDIIGGINGWIFPGLTVRHQEYER